MPSLILLIGATGYVGGRLREELERGGHRLRCLARRPDHLRARVAPTTEVVAGDLLDAGSLAPALSGVDTVFYLAHALGADRGFAELERSAARNLARAARDAGVRRVIYLGGLGHGDDLSPHLASRQEVGRILREEGPPTLEFRASIIIGSGSFSFEMIRALVQHLPVMVTPRWAQLQAQPIAIEDVLDYLLAALALPGTGSRVYEIGGADRVSYLDIMREYARQRGLRRWIIPVPVLTPWLSSLWLGLVTPVYARIGRKLILSLCNETVVRDSSSSRDFPVRPRGIAQAIARALANEEREFAQTRWSDALSSGGAACGRTGARLGTRIIDSRAVTVAAAPGAAFAPIRRIGGSVGWYGHDRLWRARGFLDLLVGGVGLRRGRRDPEHLLPGDTVDFWRVESFVEGQLLRLQAEMKLPGRAWLQFETAPADGGAVIRQTAMFDPVGLLGLLYWYALFPLHALVFRRMLRGIAAAALRAGEKAPA